jgi:Lar family restriction alleviation protein
MELKPCPFCGASAEVKSECNDYGDREYYTACTGCEAEMRYCVSPDDAANSWNRRSDCRAI